MGSVCHSWTLFCIVVDRERGGYGLVSIQGIKIVDGALLTTEEVVRI